MAIEDYYTSTIVTSRVTTSKGAMGQDEDIWADNLTIPGTIRPLKFNEIVRDNKLAIIADYMMYAGIEDILETDRAVCDSITYEVKTVRNVSVKSGHHLEILLRRII